MIEYGSIVAKVNIRTAGIIHDNMSPKTTNATHCSQRCRIKTCKDMGQYFYRQLLNVTRSTTWRSIKVNPQSTHAQPHQQSTYFGSKACFPLRLSAGFEEVFLLLLVC